MRESVGAWPRAGNGRRVLGGCSSRFDYLKWALVLRRVRCERYRDTDWLAKSWLALACWAEWFCLIKLPQETSGQCAAAEEPRPKTTSSPWSGSRGSRLSSSGTLGLWVGPRGTRGRWKASMASRASGGGFSQVVVRICSCRCRRCRSDLRLRHVYGEDVCEDREGWRDDQSAS